MNDISGENKAGAADVSASQHVMVCALKELGSLVQSLSATASPLIQEPSIGQTHTVILNIKGDIWFSALEVSVNTSWDCIDDNTQPTCLALASILCMFCNKF